MYFCLGIDRYDFFEADTDMSANRGPIINISKSLISASLTAPASVAVML